MKVSIIIPVYNVASYIRDCLLSVLHQTYTDIEIILVNDRTKDESMDVIQRILQEQPSRFPVKIVNHEKNRGLSAARNTGIRESRGDYLYFLDSDDEITTDCIETLINRVGNEYPDIIVGDYLVQGSDDFYPPLRLNTSLIKGKSNVLKAYVKESFYVMAWNKLVKRNFILKHDLFFKEGIIHEDNLWSFQCVVHAGKVAIAKHTTYLYKIRKGSITTLIAQEKEIRDSGTVVREMVHYANRHHLLGNKRVALFMEKEKLRLLYTYRKFANISSTAELYTLISSLPHPSRLRLLQRDLFHRKRLIRDAHYFLPHDCAKQYYPQVPELMTKYAYKGKRNTRTFYRWFFRVLFYSVSGRFPKDFRIPSI